MNRETNTASSALATISKQIGASRTLVDRIVADVLEDSNLQNEVASLMQTTAVMREKLFGLKNDARDCLIMLDEIEGEGLLRLTGGQYLAPDAEDRLRRRLRSRLTGHLAAVRKNSATLERGIDTTRAGMIKRFATFAVAGLMQDEEAPADRASAFMVAYLVAAHLKDRLETAGYRWAGEKTLISLYLNAVGCERRKSKDRFVADPIASIIATALHFVSARELHQSLYRLHLALCGEGSDGVSMAVGPLPGPGDAFHRAYRRAPTPEETFWELIGRAKDGTTLATAYWTTPTRPAA